MISSSANGSSPSSVRVLLDVRERGLRRLAVPLDRRSLAVARDAAVRQLDLHDIRLSLDSRAMTNVSASSSVTIREETSTRADLQRFPRP